MIECCYEKYLTDILWKKKSFRKVINIDLRAFQDTVYFYLKIFMPSQSCLIWIAQCTINNQFTTGVDFILLSSNSFFSFLVVIINKFSNVNNPMKERTKFLPLFSFSFFLNILITRKTLLNKQKTNFLITIQYLYGFFVVFFLN
jgi:hypothetical protein